jgi:acyl-CoA synthetase (AMP-forming)/AMP-acid ligase II
MGPFDSFPEPSTLVELARRRALDQPDRLVYTFLVDGESEEATLTHAELDRRARALAARLQELGAQGERALLVYPAGLDYVIAFFGCLYAGVIAVPAYPPRPRRPMDRLQSMAADSGAALALTTSRLFPHLRPQLAEAPDLEALRWLTTDDLPEEAAEDWRPLPEGTADGGSIAFLQYTSGSTAAPRGVMVSHGNLLRNLGHIYRQFGHRPESQGVIWLPPYHDMGLIGGVLQPLYGGFPVTLLSPVHFLQRPARWLQAVSRYGATTSGGPNFAYDLCVAKVSPEVRAGLDLSRWEVAFNGAEAVRPGTIDAFCEAFEPCGFRRSAFYPCYGLAEATLIVTGGRYTDEPVVRGFRKADLERGRAVAGNGGSDGKEQALVGCGESLPGERLEIVDPDSAQPCGPGQIGEIWAAGPSVGQGYWNRPEESQRVFGARLSGSGEGPYLRTGDLGFVDRGELFVTGRLRDLIIIRGSNHHPQDIELTVERSHPGLRAGCSAAFSVPAGGDERLVIVAEVEPSRNGPPDTEGLIQAISRAVSRQHDLQVDGVQLLKAGSIPKTSSGKVRRQICREGFLAGRLESVGEKVAGMIVEAMAAARSLEAGPETETEVNDVRGV